MTSAPTLATALALAVLTVAAAQPAQAMRFGGARHVLARTGAGRLMGDSRAHRSAIYSLYLDPGRH